MYFYREMVSIKESTYLVLHQLEAIKGNVRDFLGVEVHKGDAYSLNIAFHGSKRQDVFFIFLLVLMTN